MARLAGFRGGRPEGRRDERGQLLLLAAFALAVTFVALALVVNSAIYTENLASRGEGGARGDALSARHAVETELGGVVETLNVHGPDGWSELRDAMDGAVENTTRFAGRQQAAQGRYLNVSAVGHARGTRIADETPGGSTFEGTDGADQWQVASTNATRAFVLNVSRTSVGSDTFGGPRSDEFEVNVTSGTDSWLVNLSDDGGTFTVGVREPGGATATCAAPSGSGNVEVDLTAGTVGGAECPALSFASGVPRPYDIEFNNSQVVVGNYSLVVNGTDYNATALESGPTAGDTGDPYATPALYSATVRYRYDAPTVHYETDVRIAPGESDG